MTNVASVSTGGFYVMILSTDNTLYAAGDGRFGQLGDGATHGSQVPEKIMSGVKAVSAGYLHSLIIKLDNSVWCAGDNGYGELGDGTTTQRSAPEQLLFTF